MKKNKESKKQQHRHSIEKDDEEDNHEGETELSVLLLLSDEEAANAVTEDHIHGRKSTVRYFARRGTKEASLLLFLENSQLLSQRKTT